MYPTIELLALVVFLVVLVFILTGIYFLVMCLSIAENRADLCALIRAPCRKGLTMNNAST